MENQKQLTDELQTKTIKSDGTKVADIDIIEDGNIEVLLITSEYSPKDCLVTLAKVDGQSITPNTKVSYHDLHKWTGINKMESDIFRFSQDTQIEGSKNFTPYVLPVKEKDKLRFSAEYNGHVSPTPKFDITILYKMQKIDV